MRKQHIAISSVERCNYVGFDAGRTVAGNVRLRNCHRRVSRKPAPIITDIANMTKADLLPEALARASGGDVEYNPMDLLMWQVWISKRYHKHGKVPIPSIDNAVEVRLAVTLVYG